MGWVGDHRRTEVVYPCVEVTVPLLDIHRALIV